MDISNIKNLAEVVRYLVDSAGYDKVLIEIANCAKEDFKIAPHASSAAMDFELLECNLRDAIEDYVS